MEQIEFEKIMKDYCGVLNIEITQEQIEKFYKYMNLLIEWNEKINLTAITEPKDVILKHFIDCLTINKYVKTDDNLIDVGTGAGFPGIPLKIMNKDLKVVLADSLNKRINFLNEVIDELNLEKIETIHARIEELGQNKNYREKFDIVTSRAVANLATLSEYMLPLNRIGGISICMKGSDVEEELKDSRNAIKVFGGKIGKRVQFCLPKSDIGRNIIIVEKVSNTPSKYPRKAGMPAKMPIK